VDDGKSTLVGRLLYDVKALLEDQLEHVVEASRRRNGNSTVDLALVTDGLRAEREQGITIDVAHRYFSTPRRSFVLADAPGHVRYTRNMISAASRADVAVLLVDARRGLVQQTRRHAFVASLLGVPHLVLVVNKMDLVGWDERVFAGLVDEFTAFSARLAVTDVTFIPVSALHGDNVIERSPNSPWYGGSPLLFHLEHVHVASDRNLVDARLAVQWIIRPPAGAADTRRRYGGQVGGGIWRAGDEVLALPSGARSRVVAIETSDGPLTEAFPPMAIAMSLADEIELSRGDMLCRPGNRPQLSRQLDALVCWLGDSPVRKTARYVLKHTTRSTDCIVEEVRHRIDVDTLRHDESADQLELNEIGRVALRTRQPLAFDPYTRNRATGGFILIDEVTSDTVAAGLLLGCSQARGGRPAAALEAVTAAERAAALGHRGATVWMTGLPAAGKSVLAGALERAILARGRPAYRLDGDVLRRDLCTDLGFSRADRAENVRRVALLARALADAGVIAIVAVVSPHAAPRLAARAAHAEVAIEFIEVFLATPLELCERRDPKGLYARARRGELHGLTGVDDPYEPPSDPELTITPEPTDVSVQTLLEALADRGVLL